MISTPVSVGIRIEQLLRIAEEAQVTSVARDAQALLDRVREGRFFVACIGQFKRGKSTVINALLGEELLPSGVAPVTSVVTIVRFGERRARVRLGPTDWHEVAIDELDLYVAESQNPENRKGVTGVEVFCASPLLAQGLCLVDTPGIGSVFAGNTEETRSFVPHIDAALVVLGGDPPISGEELSLVESVAQQVREIIVVLNKADRLTAKEMQEARAFTESVLQRRLHAAPRVLEISALEQLQHPHPCPPRDWPTLVDTLTGLARAKGSDLVSQAASRGVEILASRLRQQLGEERDALLRPIEASQRRLEELRRCAASAEQALVELTHLFNAEQAKLTRRLDQDRERFVTAAMPRAETSLDERMQAAPVRRGPALRKYALEQAQAVTEGIVRAWMDEERPIAEREFAAVTERFVIHANAFLERLRASGELPTEALPAFLVAETGLRARGRFHFTFFMTHTTPPLWQWFADWFRSESSMQAGSIRAGRAFTKRLLEANANRVLGDFDERMIESRRSVESALRRTLQEIVSTAERAAQRASVIQQRGAAAVQAEVTALDDRLRRLSSLAQ